MNKTVRSIITSVTLSLVASLMYAQTTEDLKRSSSTPLSMSCKLKSKNNQKTVNWKTSYGSSDIDTSRQSTYLLSLRNLGKEPITLDIESIYIASAQKANFVLAKETESVELEPGKTKDIDLVTPTTEQNKTKYVSLGEKFEAGENLKGVIVRAKVDGKIVKVCASDGSWSKLAWKEPFDLNAR